MLWKKLIKVWLIILIVFNLRSLLIFTLEGPLVHFGGDSGYFTSPEITSHTASYLGYVSLVTLSNKIMLGNMGVVAAQWVISGIAGFCLYRMLLSFTAEKSFAKLFAFYYITNYELMKWNFFILSDSIFISFVIISLWFITKHRENKLFFVASGFISLYTSSIRPNGFLIFLCWVIFVFMSTLTQKGKKNILKIGMGMLVLSLFLIQMVSLGNSAGKREIFLYSSNGELIWSNRQWLINVPEGKINLDNTALGVARYSLSHPIIYGQMFVGKILVELFRIRPFLPISYNLFLIGNLMPIYVLAVVAIRNRLSQIKPFIFIITFQLLLIGTTYADWDGRFLAYILPLIILLSGIGYSIISNPTFKTK